MRNIILLISLFFFLSFSAQQNYEWLKLNQFRTAVLSDTIRENSGLTLFQDRLLTINDSGNTSEIFEIDQTSGRIKNIWQTNLANQDWEAITSDSTYIYIGDFGNNLGTRKNLAVFKMELDSLNYGAENSIEELPFYYPDQVDFKPKNLNTDFDAEAMIAHGGKIHLFTKEWASKATTHYVLDPNVTSMQAAQKIESYNTGYVITDATYLKSRLYLVGYTKKAEVYLTIFTETEPGLFFEAKPKKYYLGSSLQIGQIEGITATETGLYISGEELNIPVFKVKPFLYFIPFEKLK